MADGALCVLAHQYIRECVCELIGHPSQVCVLRLNEPCVFMFVFVCVYTAKAWHLWAANEDFCNWIKPY